MQCTNCKKEITEGSHFCPNCGFQISSQDAEQSLINSPSNETDSDNAIQANVKSNHVDQNSSPAYTIEGNPAFLKKPNRGKGKRIATIIIVFSVLAAAVGGTVFAFKEYSYNTAIKDIKNRNYEKAIAALTDLKDYKDSKTYLDKAKKERKYQTLSEYKEVDDYYTTIESITSPESVEKEMEYFYGDWYESETGEKITIDSYSIQGKEYGVSGAAYLDGNLSVKYYFFDKPTLNHSILQLNEYLEYVDTEVKFIKIFSGDSGNGGGAPETMYRSITPQQYEELSAENEEIRKIKEPAYSDDEVIEKTFNNFRNKIKSYYSGAEKIYHTATYSDANVFFDSDMQMYTCTLTGKYTTNIFDLFGTETQTYFVTAVYVDDGTSLSLIDISIK